MKKKIKFLQDGNWKRWKLFYEKMNECDLVGIKALRASSMAIWLWLWHMAMVFHKYTTHLAVIYDMMMNNNKN